MIAEVRAAVEEEAPEARAEFNQVLQDVVNDLAGIPRAGSSPADVASDLDVALHEVAVSSLRRPDRAIGVCVRYRRVKGSSFGWFPETHGFEGGLRPPRAPAT